MHDHDLDLISALVAGDDDGSGARLVESCPDCALEYRTQITIKTELARLSQPSMTTAERVAVKAAVESTISHGASVVAFPRRWARLSAVAAALLVVVGVGGLALDRTNPRLGGNDGTVAFDLASQEMTATTAAATGAATADAGLAEYAPAARLALINDLGETTKADFELAISSAGEILEEAPAGEEAPSTKDDLACLESITAVPTVVVKATIDGTAIIGFLVDGEPMALVADTCEVYPLD